MAKKQVTCKLSYSPRKWGAIDVDDTLVSGDKLNSVLVEWLEKKVKEGYKFFLWSAQGQAHAQRTAETFHVEHLFEAIISKPGLIVDDMGWSWIQHVKRVTRFK